MNCSRKSLLSILLAVGVTIGALAVAPHALAQTVDPTSGLSSFAETAGFSTGEGLTVMIARLIRTALSFLGIIAVIFILYAGFVYMTSGGNEEKTKRAKKILGSSVIGLVIILSAFTIVQFILGQLTGTGESDSSSVDDGGSYSYVDGGGTSGQFVLTSVNTDCAYAIRNLELQFLFSQSATIESANAGGIRVLQSGTAVAGTFVPTGGGSATSAKAVSFVPEQACGDDYPDTYCFDAGTDYTIEVSETLLESAGGLAYKCDATYPCTFSFTTGSGIDMEDPTMTMDDPGTSGEAVYVNSIRSLQAHAVDDTGVSSVAFSVDSTTSIYDAGLSTDSTVGSLSTDNYFSTADGTEWYVSSSYSTGSHTVRATGYDCAGNSASGTVSVEVYPSSCGNEEQDIEPDVSADLAETDVDCGGNTCGACDGDACSSNADCSSGYCAIDSETGEGVCTSIPEIRSVSPGDGAVGNLISIIGSGFGASAGTVTFLGGDGSDDDVVVNGYQCDGGADPWSDTEIVIQVSASVADGPVQVTTAADADGNAYTDATDDEYGATINDFDVNLVSRPGLCAIADGTYLGHDTLPLAGVNFASSRGSSTVYFENYEASDYYAWASDLLSVQIPLLNARSYDTQAWVGDYVCATAAGISTGVACSTDEDCNDHGLTDDVCETMRCSGSEAYCSTDDDCGSDGSCVSLRQGSNKVSLVVSDATSSTDPVILNVASGWTACGISGDHCSTDAACDAVNPGDTCDDLPVWGPPGQYVTISGTGFGSSTGYVVFTDAAGVAHGNFDFPEACGGDTWDDTEITVKVPTTYTSGDVPGGDVALGATYELSIQTNEGKVSESTNFVILDDTPGPGICSLDPSAGPASTSDVTVAGVDIAGDNLGSMKSGSADVTFSSDISASTALWSDESVTTSTVPVGSATGPVYVTDASGYRSNEMNFQVGSCSEGTITCGTDEECCSDGSCSTSCSEVPVISHYAWTFSTGDIPLVPRVRVFCGDGDGVSPGPWNGWSDSENICVNAAVNATFTLPITSIVASDIVVQTCAGTDPEDPCADLAETDLTTGAVTGEILSNSEDAFSWGPTDSSGSAEDFLPSTTYRATLIASGIHTSASPTAYMANDYSWEFTTAAESDPCTIGSIFASPSTYISIETTDDPDYSATPLSAEDECVPLRCDASGLSYSWSSSDDAAATLNDDGITSVCERHADVLAETLSGDPVTITSTLSNPNGADPSDDALLTINFLDPQVASYEPSCDTACINAAVLATFNTVMADDFTTSTVSLYSCQDSLCSNETGETMLLSGSYSVESTKDDEGDVTGFLVSHTANFEPNTWYRVVISGGVESLSGVALSESGSNYSTVENEYYPDDYSWRFKTKDSSVTCEVDRVAVSPATGSATVVGQENLWMGVPYGAEDDCSVSGQQLNASGYDWDAWTALDSSRNAQPATTDDVAMMLNSSADPIRLTSDLTDGCSSGCLNIGSPASTDDPVCGDLDVTHTSNLILGSYTAGGEECDGSSVCTTSCLLAGNSDATTCGNGTYEPSLGEECDDGDTSSANGCSSVCLNGGSSKAHTSCGDGTIDQATNAGGEDCDDGNVVSGDGCSSVCLNEGGVDIAGIYSVCGDGVIGDGVYSLGEDCDDGNTDDDDGCSSACLYEGASVCAFECVGGTEDGTNCTGLGATCAGGGVCSQASTPCCGDSVLDYSSYPSASTDRSEDCDDGNTTDGDGCSSSCLNEGSSISYATKSYCGDGDIGFGEECDASSDAAYSGYWGVSRINASAASDVVDGLALSAITATESASSASGEGTLSLICSCEEDSQCGETSAYGCGTSGCCFTRPEIVDQYPMDLETDVCRNTSIFVDFSDVMDEDSLVSWTDSDDDGAFDYGEGHQNLYLELVSMNGVAVTADNCPSSYTQASLAYSTEPSGSWIARAWNWISRSVREIFGGTANAAPSTDFACLVPVLFSLTSETMTLDDVDSVGSHVELSISDPLEALSVYRLVVVEDADPTNGADTISGVLSANAISVDFSGDGSITSSGEEGAGKEVRTTFTTGSEVCTLDEVLVEDLGNVDALVSGSIVDPSIGTFTSSDEEHSVLATAYSVRNGQEEPIQETTAYGWTWAWGTTIEDGSETDIVSASDADQTDSVATAAGLTGLETIVSTASFRAENDSAYETSGGVSGTLQIAANICDNPAVNGTYSDTSGTTPSNFSFYYCLDYGVEGDTTDDLPDLEEKIEVTSYTTDIIQELIFKVSDTSDAIGIRVLPNEEYLTPAAWYLAKEFTGSPTATEVDGYQAVVEGNTTYVAATNVTDSGTIYPNIYVLSYTEGAGSFSQEIFRQILANWSFNANTSVVTDVNLCRSDADLSYETDADGNFLSCDWNGDCLNLCEISTSSTEGTCSLTGDVCSEDADCAMSCDGEKASLARDMGRLEDVTMMAGLLDEYGTENGLCSVTTNMTCASDSECPGSETCQPSAPSLSDGTFVRSYSVSTWPSWASGLGNALGTSLPNDPLDEFYRCENTCDADTSTCTLSPSDSCVSDSDCGSFESDTCWNSVSATFACPDESHVYGYQSVGGTSYRLRTELEYDGGIWAYGLTPSTETTASGDPFGVVTAEYDHSLTGSETFPDNITATASFCKGDLLGATSICGDGVIGTNGSGVEEVCEIGGTKTISCTDASLIAGTMVVTCNSSCSAYLSESEAEALNAVCSPYACGNGVVDGASEECDDGSYNGSYGHCGDDCKLSSAFYCGDGYLAGGEQCDCGTVANFSSLASTSWAVLHSCANSNGQYQTSPTGSCAYDCTTPGPSCGDGEVNGDELCDGDHEVSGSALCDDGTECSSDSDCSTGTCGGTYASCGSGTVCSGATDVASVCYVNGDCESGSCDLTAHECNDVGDQGIPCVVGTDAYADGSGSCDFECGATVYSLERTRNCSATTYACTWSTSSPTDPGWSDCVSSDYCGNGSVDGTEQCDDGNDDNTDACTTSCKENVCGDNYVYSGVESCDDGSGNGGTCDASYDSTCHFCSASCTYKTRSGDYCGDGEVNGTEFCDGSDISGYCYDDTSGKGVSCSSSNLNTTTGCSTGSTCRQIGVCDGGTENGDYCTVGITSGSDYNACSGGTCVAPSCADDCGSSCPLSFETVSVLANTEEAGASATDTIDLYSYGNANGDTPQNASITLPACTVGTEITADINTSEVVAPTVAVYFLTDYSDTMSTVTDSGLTRIEVVGAATQSAVSELFLASPENLKIGMLRIGTYRISDGDAADGYYVDSELPSSGTSDENELLTLVDDYVTGYETVHSGGPSAYNGMLHAIQRLDAVDADIKAIILLSDGEIGYDKDVNSGTSATNAGTCEDGTASTCNTTSTDVSHYCSVKQIDMGLLNACSADGDDGAVRGLGEIFVYTAAISSSSSATYANYMAHLSSETCGTSYNSYGDCEHGTYAFSGYSESEISGMYEAIIDSILNVTVGLTTSTVTSTTVTSGHNKTMPFPSDFACTGEDMEIPMTVEFNGSGYITMSNISFTYCPVQ